MLAALLMAGAAQARTQAVINVTGTEDHAEGEAEIEYCTPEQGPKKTEECPLRAALELTNAFSVEEVLVNVPAGHYKVTKGPGLPLGAKSPVVLRGAGAGTTDVEGTGIFPIIQVQSSATAPVALEGVTIGPGNTGILDEAPSRPLALRHTVVSHVDNSGIRMNGAGRVDIIDSAFIGDSNSTTGGAIDSFSTTIDVVRSTLSGNHALQGGAARVGSGSVTFVDSTLAENSATGGGGGALTGNGIVLRHDTIAGNKAATSGGGLGGGSYTLEGTILSGNTPGQCEGGTLTMQAPTSCSARVPAPCRGPRRSPRIRGSRPWPPTEVLGKRWPC